MYMLTTYSLQKNEGGGIQLTVAVSQVAIHREEQVYALMCPYVCVCIYVYVYIYIHIQHQFVM